MKIMVPAIVGVVALGVGFGIGFSVEKSIVKGKFQEISGNEYMAIHGGKYRSESLWTSDMTPLKFVRVIEEKVFE